MVLEPGGAFRLRAAAAAHGRRRWLWGQMALLPLWAVCQFSAIELMNMANFDFRSMKLLLLNLLVCCILPLFLMVLLRRGALALPISA